MRRELLEDLVASTPSVARSLQQQILSLEPLLEDQDSSKQVTHLMSVKLEIIWIQNSTKKLPTTTASSKG